MINSTLNFKDAISHLAAAVIFLAIGITLSLVPFGLAASQAWIIIVCPCFIVGIRSLLDGGASIFYLAQVGEKQRNL